jgi:hypothetical protein
MLVAAWSGHWDVAARQLELLESTPSPRVIPAEQMNKVVEEIKKHSKPKN